MKPNTKFIVDGQLLGHLLMEVANTVCHLSNDEYSWYKGKIPEKYEKIRRPGYDMWVDEKLKNMTEEDRQSHHQAALILPAIPHGIESGIGHLIDTQDDKAAAGSSATQFQNPYNPDDANDPACPTA